MYPPPLYAGFNRETVITAQHKQTKGPTERRNQQEGEQIRVMRHFRNTKITKVEVEWGGRGCIFPPFVHMFQSRRGLDEAQDKANKTPK